MKHRIAMLLAKVLSGKNSDKKSMFINRLGFKGYNSKIKNRNTDFDWLLRSLRIELSGSGDITFANATIANDLNVSLRGSGDIRGNILTGRNATLSLAGSGDIDLSLGHPQRVEAGYLFRSGGGITINSRCDDEYRETQQKVYLPF